MESDHRSESCEDLAQGKRTVHQGILAHPYNDRMSRSFEPIACSLPARDASDQVGEWHDLTSRALTKHRIAEGYEITFSASEAALVDDLARRESACCGFLKIATEQFEGGIRLLMTSNNPEAMPVIDLLVGSRPD